MGRSRVISGIKPREYRALVQLALDQGWKASVTGGTHIRLDPPTGGTPVYAGFSVSDHRAVRNLRSLLRSRGVVC